MQDGTQTDETSFPGGAPSLDYLDPTENHVDYQEEIRDDAVMARQCPLRTLSQRRTNRGRALHHVQLRRERLA